VAVGLSSPCGRALARTDHCFPASDTWGYKVLSVSQALTRWAERVGRDPTRTYIWICSLCLNQHRIGETDVSPEDLAKEFGPRVQSIGRILPMLEPWRNPSE
jgi:hypothetical protein